jgi:hypothetical protein
MSGPSLYPPAKGTGVLNSGVCEQLATTVAAIWICGDGAMQADCNQDRIGGAFPPEADAVRVAWVDSSQSTITNGDRQIWRRGVVDVSIIDVREGADSTDRFCDWVVVDAYLPAPSIFDERPIFCRTECTEAGSASQGSAVRSRNSGNVPLRR